MMMLMAVGLTAGVLPVYAQDNPTPIPRLPTSPAIEIASGNISGRVVLPSGHPINDRVRITLSTMTDPGMLLYTDNTGAFNFSGLRPGTYTVEAIGDGKLYDPVSEQITLLRGMRANLVIRLREKSSSSATKPGEVVSLNEVDLNVPAAAKKEYDKGSKFSNEGKAQEAIAAFKKALDIYPNYLIAHNDLGVQYLNLKRPAEAAEQFGDAIEINPKAFNPRLNMGIALVNQKKYNDALDHLTLAVSINSSSPSAHLYFGIAALETDDLATALREIDSSQTLGGPEYCLAHYFRARVALKKGEGGQAIAELNAYLKNAPNGEYAAAARALLEELKHN